MSEPFEEFLNALSRATNETQKRESFIALAATGFGAGDFATELALSSEYKVRFESAGVVRRGAIDAFYGNLVIEFERDLARTGEHALDQLKGYVAGAWTEDGSAERPYLAVATDGTHWEVYTPNLGDPHAVIAEENITLDLNERYPAVGESVSADTLRDFLNRLFFRQTLLKPTAEAFSRDFGLSSPAFLAAQPDLLTKLEELQEHPRLQVMRRAWSSSLQVSYGSIETDDELFAKHTYLAVLARLLVWAALERRPMRFGEVGEVLDGRYFVGQRISNLVEDDYFRWYEIESRTDAHRLWVALSHHLAGYDLTEVGEDVLKPLYEQLVDPVFRHDLGEYYTPDWLAERVVGRVLADVPTDESFPRVLDPTCGSGTFLRATIAELRRNTTLEGRALAEEIVRSVAGIDVHPLAVIIARATYLLAIKDLTSQFLRPITIPVYMANSLRFPAIEPHDTLFGERVPLSIEGADYLVPLEFVQDTSAFDDALDDVLAVARSYGRGTGPLGNVPRSLRARLGKRLDHFRSAAELIDVLAQMALRIAELIRSDLDSVHGFMLKNHYRPAMLRGRFDYIVGNPPWLTVADVRETHYKALILKLNAYYGTAPRSAGQQAHTELATIFLPHVVHHFLADSTSSKKVRVGLVMPRSVFTASHHGPLREGRYRPAMNVEELWDLTGVKPLFNVPASVVFSSTRTARPSAGRPLRIVTGRLPGRDVPESVARPHLTERRAVAQLAFLGKRSAWREELATVTPADRATPSGFYASRFRQGAIIYPQTLFIVTAPVPLQRRTGPVRVRTDPRAALRAKVLADKRVRHLVDGENLYVTVAAEHIYPYTLSGEPWLAILPTVADPGEADFGPVSPDTLREHGRVDTASWLEWADRQWARVRKQDGFMPLWERLDHLGQLTAQRQQQRYLVLYTASGSRAFASVIDRKSLPLPFVVRDKTYWASWPTPEEAYYVCGFLNSEWAADRIVDWMTRGLLGPRDIHKRILDLPLPRFDPSAGAHRVLAQTARDLARQAKHSSGDNLPHTLGRARLALRARLRPSALNEVEVLVDRLCSASLP